MLYFSSRPVNPNTINLSQSRKLRKFKDATYRTALVGGFTSPGELKVTLLRDLSAQVRQMTSGKQRRGHRDKIEQAEKLTQLILLHRQHGITPEQIDEYKELLGLTEKGRKSAASSENPYRGMFFDYIGTVSAFLNKSAPQDGWSCSVDIWGENYENKQFELNSLAVNIPFDSAEEALEHGKQIFDLLGIECVDTRTEEL